jgi:hypothetical protein
MNKIIHDKCVPVTTTRLVLRLRMEERPPIWRVAANILNKQSRTDDKRWSAGLGVGRGAEVRATPRRKNWSCYERIHVPQAWIDLLVRRKQWKRNMGFGMQKQPVKVRRSYNNSQGISKIQNRFSGCTCG